MIMNTLVVKAPAKINLAIDVLNTREDHYHEVDMISIPLKLHDSIEICALGKGYDTYLYCDDPTLVCDESNLAYKALDVMKTTFSHKKEYQISIHKKIPVEAGLGGGSADAAAVMKAINIFMQRENKSIDLNALALSIGSDVPFCLKNIPSRVQGIGEKLTPIKVAYPYHVLIVKPDKGLSTADVYRDFDSYPGEIKHPNIPALIKALETDDEEKIEKNLINVLYYPASRALNDIVVLIEDMKKMGLKLCGMSGTGSACFGISKDRKFLEKVCHIFSKKGYQTYLTQFAI